MNNLLENQISMFINTETTLNNNVAATASVPLIATEKAIYSSKLAILLSKSGVAGLDITGNTVEKQDKRDALTRTTIIVSRAITLHAQMTGNKELLEKFDLSLSNLNAMRDSEFYMQCLVTKDNASTLATNLLPYSITPILLTQLNTELTAYYAVLQKPKNQINVQSILREEINNLAEEINAILKNKLDIAMSLFQFSNPSLYALYQNARSIDNTGSTTTADYQGDVPSNTILVVANIPYLISREFKLKNTGSQPLSMSLSADPNTMQGAILTINAGEESNYILSTALNPDVNSNNLLLQNNSPLQVSYKIYINE